MLLEHILSISDAAAHGAKGNVVCDQQRPVGLCLQIITTRNSLQKAK